MKVVFNNINIFKKGIFLLLCGMFLLLMSCSTKKSLAYLQEESGDSTMVVAAQELYDARIKPKDLLTVTVNTFDREASVPFNLMFPSGSALPPTNTNGENSMQKYLVDNDGNIDFPVLGKIKVADMTKNQVEAYLKDKDTVLVPKAFEKYFTPAVTDLLRRFNGNLIECYYEMDEGSVLYLEAKIKRLLEEKSL